MSSRDAIIHLTSKESTNSSTSDLLNITTSKLSSEVLPQSDIPLSKITLVIEDISIYDPLSLASLIPNLRNDGEGQVIIQMPSDADTSSVHTSITLAGLTPQSETSNEEQTARVITALYNSKNKSSTSAIQINKQNHNQKQKVKINIGALAEDDELMINEDDLLSSNANGMINAPTEVDMAERQKKLDDCGGRKACDNCTCGRKEMEENGGTVAEEKKSNSNIKSACGNCAKGDAFRCANCPFLGKPAFKEGEEHLVLDLTDDL